MMNKIEEHKNLCNKLNELYSKKNAAYGDSFGDTFQKLGIISAITRITDKYNRLVTLSTNPKIPFGDESIKDTLIDLSNYCLMTILEIERSEDNKHE